MTRLLVFGRLGQVARELQRLAPTNAVFLGRDEFDLVRKDPAEAIAALKPTSVINAAGYTAVDLAESEPDLAMRLNAAAPGEMARACAAGRIAFVHLSSDYVFRGDKRSAYVEGDAPDPLTAYGRSKAEGERLVLAAGGLHAILRTSWVFSAHGSNFLKTMLRLAQTRAQIAVVDNQVGRPTWARDVANAVLTAAGRMSDLPLGMLHTAGGEAMSWANFAERIFEHAASRGLPSATVRRIATVDYPTPARRPANSDLAIDFVTSLLGWRPTPLDQAIDACLTELETA